MTTIFYASPEDIEDERLWLSPEESRHAIRVLRNSAGDEIEVVDGVGGSYRVRLDVLDERRAGGRIQSRDLDRGEPRYELTLAVCLLKNANRFETLVEKAVELGVRRFIPLETTRTERTRVRVDRLDRIALAAMKQSGRSRLLEILQPVEFAAFASTASGTRILCHESASGDHSITRVLAGAQRALTVAIGPEGGFTDDEVRCAADDGFAIASLGARRLRTETAGIVAAAAVSLHFDPGAEPVPGAESFERPAS